MSILRCLEHLTCRMSSLHVKCIKTMSSSSLHETVGRKSRLLLLFLLMLMAPVAAGASSRFSLTSTPLCSGFTSPRDIIVPSAATGTYKRFSFLLGVSGLCWLQTGLSRVFGTYFAAKAANLSLLLQGAMLMSLGRKRTRLKSYCSASVQLQYYFNGRTRLLLAALFTYRQQTSQLTLVDFLLTAKPAVALRRLLDQFCSRLPELLICQHGNLEISLPLGIVNNFVVGRM